MPELTSAERNALAHVLELRPAVTRKGTPKLQSLSLYSSELKGQRQIAGTLVRIRDRGNIADDDVPRDRYFNTLSNQGLVSGTPAKPFLTPAANFYLAAWDIKQDDDGFWRTEAAAVELDVIRSLVEQLQNGEPVSNFFKEAWFNAQTFFDLVPGEELDVVLKDPERLLFLSQINSVGWEIGRYFRLPLPERQAFDDAFRKIPPTPEWSPTVEIEKAAAKYKDAAKQFQKDVRFRISGFLNAYRALELELGAALPRLDRALRLRGGSSTSLVTSTPTTEQPTTVVDTRLAHPRQLIVTGCPGSGKSHFVDELIKSSGCTVFRTQFHPETSYADFFGTYKPAPLYERTSETMLLFEGDGSAYERGRPLIDYRFVPGPFMSAFTHALTHPAENVVLLIEEINRGNPAAIFGDLLQLLDREELTGSSRYPIIAAQDVKSYFSKLGHNITTLRLPANLYLWATMNSADQGVFPMDTAFRRRWNFIYKGYTEACRYSPERAMLRYGGEMYSWDLFRRELNQQLVNLNIHEDKLIGPYFLTEQQLADPTSVLQKLFLYLWDDVLRFRQTELFTARSFSEVVVLWSAGAGHPLRLTLPEVACDPDPIAELSQDVEDLDEAVPQ